MEGAAIPPGRKTAPLRTKLFSCLRKLTDCRTFYQIIHSLPGPGPAVVRRVREDHCDDIRAGDHRVRHRVAHPPVHHPGVPERALREGPRAYLLPLGHLDRPVLLLQHLPEETEGEEDALSGACLGRGIGIGIGIDMMGMVM